MANFDAFEKLAEKWPSTLVARQRVREFSGGALSPKLLANLDCEGRGPAGRMMVGRQIVYPVDALIDFMKHRTIRKEA
jgi:hypothetical protein